MQLQTCPWGEYRGGSSLDNNPVRIAPGKWIQVDEIGDLHPLSFNSNAHLLVSEEDRNWRYGEWLLSVSPLSQGMVPQQVGPTRSTSGVVALLQQMDKQFKPSVDQLAVQWRKLEYLILEDLDFRVDPALKIRILGPSIKDVNVMQNFIQEFGQTYLLTKLIDLKIDVASIINSDEVKRNEASLILMQLLNPSLLQQSGIVGPKGLYKAIEDYLKAFGRNPEQYLDEPQFITQPLTLWQEVQICAQGEIPPMSMLDNHEEKAQGLLAFVQSPEYQEALTKGIYVVGMQEWISKAASKHLSLAQALKARGQPNPTGEQGIDYNALMSGQAPQQKTGGEDGTPKGEGNNSVPRRKLAEAIPSTGMANASGDRGGAAP